MVLPDVVAALLRHYVAPDNDTTPPPKKIAIHAYGAFGPILDVRKTLYTGQNFSMQKTGFRRQKSELMCERRGKHHTKTVVVDDAEAAPVPRPAANI